MESWITRFRIENKRAVFIWKDIYKLKGCFAPEKGIWGKLIVCWLTLLIQNTFTESTFPIFSVVFCLKIDGNSLLFSGVHLFFGFLWLLFLKIFDMLLIAEGNQDRKFIYIDPKPKLPCGGTLNPSLDILSWFYQYIFNLNPIEQGHLHIKYNQSHFHNTSKWNQFKILYKARAETMETEMFQSKYSQVKVTQKQMKETKKPEPWFKKQVTSKLKWTTNSRNIKLRNGKIIRNLKHTQVFILSTKSINVRLFILKASLDSFREKKKLN